MRQRRRSGNIPRREFKDITNTHYNVYLAEIVEIKNPVYKEDKKVL